MRIKSYCLPAARVLGLHRDEIFPLLSFSLVPSEELIRGSWLPSLRPVPVAGRFVGWCVCGGGSEDCRASWLWPWSIRCKGATRAVRAASCVPTWTSWISWRSSCSRRPCTTSPSSCTPAARRRAPSPRCSTSAAP
uniref:Uncharacterized protein n=1 Tax=Aegilops tauschii subsp. strangulata TaxID=200361 RepID=A0A453J2N1_AEGTS